MVNLHFIGAMSVILVRRDHIKALDRSGRRRQKDLPRIRGRRAPEHFMSNRHHVIRVSKEGRSSQEHQAIKYPTMLQ